MTGPTIASSAGPHAGGSFQGVVEWLAARPRRAFLVIFSISFSLGLALLPFVPPIALVPHTRWEVEAVAVSLARFGTFADPYALPTGPTAHMPPAYPFFLSLIYRAFGLTPTAGYVAWLLRVAVSSAMLAMLPWLSDRLGTGTEAGVIGGMAGALIPRWPSQVEAPTAIALGLLLVAFLGRWKRERNSARASFLLGVAWGAAFHLSSSLLAVLAGCMLFELWWSADRRKWAWSLLIALGVVLACLPWTWRNHGALGDVFFVRSNFGLELRMGNHDGALPDVDQTDVVEGGAQLHPRTNLAEARLVQELGEREYMRRAGRQALEWIGQHPATFLSLTARRAAYFWFGSPFDPTRMLAGTLLTLLALMGARRALPALDPPQRAAFLVPLAAYPLVYYLVVFTPRYSEPLNGLLLMLAGAGIWSSTTGTSRRKSG